MFTYIRIHCTNTNEQLFTIVNCVANHKIRIYQEDSTTWSGARQQSSRYVCLFINSHSYTRHRRMHSMIFGENSFLCFNWIAEWDLMNKVDWIARDQCVDEFVVISNWLCDVAIKANKIIHIYIYVVLDLSWQQLFYNQ